MWYLNIRWKKLHLSKIFISFRSIMKNIIELQLILSKLAVFYLFVFRKSSNTKNFLTDVIMSSTLIAAKIDFHFPRRIDRISWTVSGSECLTTTTIEHAHSCGSLPNLIAEMYLWTFCNQLINIQIDFMSIYWKIMCCWIASISLSQEYVNAFNRRLSILIKLVLFRRDITSLFLFRKIKNSLA